LVEWKVPLFDLDLGEEEYGCLKAVLDSKWLSMGEVTEDFESAFADYLGVRHALAVSSGTAAMHLAHNALGLKHGDEVICPSLTFVATANAILYTGAMPVFADIRSLDDFTISPDDIESKINERTRGIVVVHYAGFPCNMDRIMEIARKYGLFVVEDAAHAVGGEYSARRKAQGARRKAHSAKQEEPEAHSSKLKAESSDIEADSLSDSSTNDSRFTSHDSRAHKLGTISDIGCFSFFANKNMTTAEGGMVVTNRDDLAEKMRIARSHGMTSLTRDRYKGHSFSYDVVCAGFNYRIDELRSALGLVQLKKLDRNNRRRRSLWTLYRQKLDGVEGINIPFSCFSGISSCHVFPVLVSEEIDRKGFMAHFCEEGIQTSIHYPPIHLFSYYKNLIPSDTHLPLTEFVGRREVTLPLFPAMEEQHIECVVNAAKNYLVTAKT
jgi:dTDP-4-amino-4,6-dideoxygalactose transaminase